MPYLDERACLSLGRFWAGLQEREDAASRAARKRRASPVFGNATLCGKYLGSLPSFSWILAAAYALCAQSSFFPKAAPYENRLESSPVTKYSGASVKGNRRTPLFTARQSEKRSVLTRRLTSDEDDIRSLDAERAVSLTL